jgi:hypothetical protein
MEANAEQKQLHDLYALIEKIETAMLTARDHRPQPRLKSAFD